MVPPDSGWLEWFFSLLFFWEGVITCLASSQPKGNHLELLSEGEERDKAVPLGIIFSFLWGIALANQCPAL